ncbi:MULTISPECIES: host attachment family protein [unclassified Sphingomonas]|uniref:host attachment family protein n=1 Tax=unclassified Sphingomonas TaxID=196159 RepID=UPI0006F73FA7|nr:MULTISPECIES: host attachment family protein [unclassified Sphingomonas]KQX18110.1 Host attachment protein [Sphingomonas sp. Root1294]KQY72665.1 Host attachment protein [Sphingomonas sp. Root50]KRB87708.1 Host attachment protein [Sphingomonas sp. Root720]
MRISHDALVLVADGRKSLFLRNEGDAEFLNLVVEDQRAQAGLEDRDLKTDAPGRAMSQVGGRQGTMEEPDYHQMEEDRFAKDTAELLARRVRQDGIDQLVVVAPPRTLGELRQHYDKAVEAKIVAEVDKDLVNHPIDKLEEVLKGV